jgi:hypothetical protein
MVETDPNGYSWKEQCSKTFSFKELEKCHYNRWLVQLVSAPLQQAWDTLNLSLYWNYCSGAFDGVVE